jgi:hypothetical protein
LLSRARSILEAGGEFGSYERLLDREYAALIPSDGSLVERFEQHLKSSPSEYAPLRPKDVG